MNKTNRLTSYSDTKQLPPTWLDLSPEGAALGDPLCELLVKFPVWYSVALAFILHGALFVYEAIVSIGYHNQHTNTLTLFDSEEFFSAVPSYFIYGPLIWWFYSWQPRIMSIVCRRLIKENFIGKQFTAPLPVSVLAPPNWRRRIFTSLSMVALVCVGTYLYAWVHPPPCGTGFASCFGKPDSWLTRSDLFFKWFWTPIFALNLVLLVTILFRQAGIAYAFSRLFKCYQLRPKLFHPDECSGLGFVGGFFISTAWFVVLMSGWLVFVLFYPTFTGYGSEFTPYDMFYVAGASIGVPLFSLVPLMSIHGAMYRAREAHLLSLMGEIQPGIPSDPNELNDAVARLDIYAHIEKAHVLIPVPRRRIAFFLMTALFPPAFAAISLFVQLIQTLQPIAVHKP